MSIKKTINLICILSLTIFILTACGGGGSSSTAKPSVGTDGLKWSIVGEAGISTGEAKRTSVAATEEAVYVAFRDQSGVDEDGDPICEDLKVMTYNGSVWESVGSSVGVCGGSFSLAVNQGILYIAYQDAENDKGATVRKFENGSWLPVGNAGINEGTANNVVLKFNQNTPYVHVGIGLSGTSIYKFNGTDWEAVGGEKFLEKVSAYSSFAVESPTSIYYAYQSSITEEDEVLAEERGVNAYSAFGSKLVVMKFDGTGWTYVGSATGLTSDKVFDLDMCVIAGEPYVSFKQRLTITPEDKTIDQDGVYEYRVSVMKYNGTDWEFVGGEGGISEKAGQYTSIFEIDGTPYVAYRDDSNFFKALANVKKWDGSAWVSVGNPDFSSKSASFISTATTGGKIYVSFIEGSKPTIMMVNLNAEKESVEGEETTEETETDATEEGAEETAETTTEESV